MTLKIKKGDKVLVISGKDRGKIGEVLRVFPKLRKIVVEGAGLQKKHIRPRRMGEKGEIVQQSSPIPVSRVKLICSNCQKPTRVGYKIEGEKKYRMCKKCKNFL